MAGDIKHFPALENIMSVYVSGRATDTGNKERKQVGKSSGYGCEEGEPHKV